MLSNHNNGLKQQQPLRIAFAGDSITWGDGLLDDSYVAYVDEWIRKELAALLPHSSMSYSGAADVIRSRKFFGGSATRLSGTGSEASFRWNGDRLTVVQAYERTNDSAAMIELYVDGALFDTFSSYNPEPAGQESRRFVGDGETVRFDLGRCFTYDHAVQVDGKPLQAALNKGGYGAGFPEELDVMIIRNYGDHPQTGEKEVRHNLSFRTAPAAGTVIEATYRYGEPVAYARSTIGECGESYESPLESRFGYGQIAFDPARPYGLSSGLDFRQTDERAVKTWQLPSSGAEGHDIAFRIRGFDPRGGERGEPSWIVNFATDCFHRLLNAGIGGWKASLFNTDDGLRHIRYVTAFRPDLLFVGLGTNDDWEDGNGFVASRLAQGVTEEQVRRLPTLFLRSCRPAAAAAGAGTANTYDIETAELKVAAAAEASVTIDSAHAVFDGVRPGDIVAVGDYGGDNRNVLCRVIEHWDESTCTATFAEPLHATPTTKRIADFAGQAVRIKRIDTFIGQMAQLLETVRAECPDVKIGLLDTGLSNYYARPLFGYAEKLARLASEYQARRVAVYPAVMHWQYEQPADQAVYIGEAGAVQSTGAAEYTLLTADGRDPNEAAGTTLRSWSVQVDGVERLGDGCLIEGGYGLAFKPESEAGELVFDQWRGTRWNLAIGYRFIPLRLVFTRDVPAEGATIEVKVSGSKWSLDDAHLGTGIADSIYADEVVSVMREMLAEGVPCS